MIFWFVFACLAPVAIQGVVMFFDEFHFHHQRGLGRWERIGHPLDTVTFLAALAVPFLFPYGPAGLLLYAGLGVFSCVFVTKDEWVHARSCKPLEAWLHALLFLLHPLVFVGFGLLWWASAGNEAGVSPVFFATLLGGQLAATALFLCYQVTYWLLLGKGRHPDHTEGSAFIQR